MSTSLFDSHCHLEDAKFDGDRADVLTRMAENHVDHCICAGSDLESSAEIVKLAEGSDVIYGVVGFHPQEAHRFQPEALCQLRQWLALPRIIGVGEIGLDYHWDEPSREQQMAALEAQLELAVELDVPAVFHVRDAHGDFVQLLRARRQRLPRGVLHCYSGSVESAKEYLDMGFYLSFAGPVTFKNAGKAQEVAAYCPIDRLLVETDSPYLAPTPCRGQRNEPALVRYTARQIAALRHMEADELIAQATANTKRLYRLS